MVNFLLSLVKDEQGALEQSWVASIVQTFGLRAFVETGTYLGDSLSNASSLVSRSVSIELSDDLYVAAQKRFDGRSDIHLLHGDSTKKILDAIELCRGLPTLYWLDAHWSAGNTARGEENTPILAELDRMADRVSADDVVLVDDMRHFISIPQGFETHEANSGYPRISEVVSILEKFPGGGFGFLLMGDVLICMSKANLGRLQVSEALEAITVLRTQGNLTAAQIAEREQQITFALPSEKRVFRALPSQYVESLKYGLGGEYLYWRSLIHESERDYVSAAADLNLARRCGLDVPLRPWEGASLGARFRRFLGRCFWLVHRHEAV